MYEIHLSLFSGIRYDYHVLWKLMEIDRMEGDLRLLAKELLSVLAVAFFWGGVFLGPHVQHMEVPRLGIESEL